MIEEGSGNLLTADTDALVNTVNTVGVMGKGIALQFKRAHPDNYVEYRAAFERGELSIGRILVFDTGRMGPGRYILNFPTKRHWRSPSRLEDIRAGLDDLIRVVRELGLTSLAVPALGAGNGGLDWRDVRPLIEAAAERMPGVRVVVFPPAGAPPAEAMPVGTPRPVLSRGWAVLLLTMSRYLARANTLESRSGVSELEIQKLAYFLQLHGVRLDLTFDRGRKGRTQWPWTGSCRTWKATRPSGTATGRPRCWSSSRSRSLRTAWPRRPRCSPTTRWRSR